jgi:hypothetical protein
VRLWGFVFLASLVTGCVRSSALPVAVTAASHRATTPAEENLLLYVSDAGNNDVNFYTWPNLRFRATLTGFGAVRGLCASPTGSIYIVDAQNDDIVRYGHGAQSPSKILYDQGYHPNGCAVDRVTGKLAVTLISESSGQPGVLALFTHAAGRPVYYGIANIFTPAYCAFDSKGNLFIDGTDKKGNFALGEMAFGYHSVSTVTLKQTIGVPGGVQWDGTYLVIGDQGTSSKGSTLYQFTIAGGAGTLEGTVPLGESAKVAQFWTGSIKLVGPNSGGSEVGIWSYPAGGQPLKTIGGFKKPIAAVVTGA